MNEAYQIDNNIAPSTVDFIWNLSIPTPSLRNHCYEMQDSKHSLIGQEDEVILPCGCKYITALLDHYLSVTKMYNASILTGE